MTLLPRSAEEFSSAQYWERFFKKRGEKAFEWYGDYNKLCGVLHKYMKLQDKVLVVGCGNSELSEQMYDVGYKQLTNIDISETVVTHMNQRNAERRPHLAFQRVDATQTPYEDASYQACLDKGTLDAMASEEEGALARRMLTEVARVLCVGGRYVCVTLAQECVLRLAVEHFVSLGWAVRLHCLQEEAEGGGGGGGDDSFPLPVFVLICTRFRQPMPAPILEVCLGEDGAPNRFAAAPELLTAVRELQSYAVLRKRLRTSTDASSSPSLTLSHVTTGLPRYTLTVQDSAPNAKVPRGNYFGIFIVPQGKETDWQYGSSEGRSQLAASANFKRLVIVSMHREQVYTDMQAVQAELSQMVPFLSVGGELGWREVVSRGASELSGEYCVEDVRGEDRELYRRLVFLSNAGLVQSEGRLVSANAAQKKKSKRKVKQTALPASLHRCPPCGRRLPVLRSPRGGRSFDVIMFDVDSKDSTVGMSCPPRAFVEASFLEKVHNLLNPKGVFMLNLACRDSTLRGAVVERLRGAFPRVFSRKIDGEVNEVLLCCRGDGTPEGSSPSSPPPLPSAQAAKSLQAALCSHVAGRTSCPHIDIIDLLKDLKVA
ncbi:hypothetical protein CRUP_008807 [Coryphaenoides rupestris]|nr:hypothetical protein CRUP_008807 [Coryphaenoides rupestris]